jgi:hypothetical protein
MLYIVNNAITQKAYYKEMYVNPYEAIHAITPRMFKETIKRNFKPENFYMRTMKDYFWFPYEGFVIFLLSLAAVIVLYKKFGSKIRKRDILLKRRLSNIFIGSAIFITELTVTEILSDWVEYGIIKLFNIDMLKIKYFGTPTDYVMIFVSLMLFVGIYIVVLKVLFGWYYPKVFVTKKHLVLGGGRPKFIELDKIKSLEVVPWSLDKFRHIYGHAIFFFKKLLKVTTDDGKIYYLRAWNAKHLKEDIEGLLQKNV